MSHVPTKRVVVLALLVLGVIVSRASAQVPAGTILGSVKDPQGLAISGAEVTLTNQGTLVTHTAKTVSIGAFEFTDITFGVYRIDVTDAGFKTASVRDIKLDASTEYTVPPIVLQVGALSETVSVEAGAEEVRTVGAELTDTVGRQQIEDLPILDRDPLHLLALVGGVNQNGRSETVIDGQRQSFSNVTLDGVNIQDNFVRAESLDYTPNLLLISQTGEFTVTTQNAGPQAGGGSSQVSIVTPAGTNQFHGEGFWYYRAGALAANNWFNDFDGVAKPNLVQNQAGGDLGGPIIKDKLFVYGAYELLRYRQQVLADTTILSSLARQGTFQWRADCATASNPQSGLPTCPIGVAPGSIQQLNLLNYVSNRDATTISIDPAISQMLQEVPNAPFNAPGFGDGLNTGGYAFNQRNNDTRDNTSVRLDWNASTHHSFSATYAWNRQVLDLPDSELGLNNTYNSIPDSYDNDKENFLSAAWRWSPSSNFTNEVRFGFDLAPINFLTRQPIGASTISGTLFNNPNQNFFTTGDIPSSLPSNRNTHTWSWQDNASKQWHSHLFVFGMQVQRVTVDAQSFANIAPDLDLTNPNNTHLLTSSDFANIGGISSADLATADSLLSTLAGFVGAETQTFNVTSPTSGFAPGAALVQNFSYDNWALYFGDTWKVRPNLTITYGLRWDYFSPFDERNGLLQFPVVSPGETVQQALLSNATLSYFGGNTGQPAYRPDLDNFAPNIGIAWDPFGNGKTSIRAGYSISYVNDELMAAADFAALGNPGVTSQTGLSSFYLPNATLSNTVPGIATPQLSNTFQGNWLNLYGADTGNSFADAIDPHLQTPYVQQWNLSIQRELGWNTSVTVSYVGNHGVRMYRAIDVNQVQINGNGFLQAFNQARQNGFASQAAGHGFNPCYVAASPGSPDCSANNPAVAYFANNFLYGNLSTYYPALVDQYLQQGAVGSLADLYHGIGSDSSYLYNYYYGINAPVSLAPNQYLEGADLLGNYSSSTYNAGMVEVRRRVSNGLNLQASYTFSKILTDYSADTAAGEDRFLPYLDNANPGLEKARADYDITNAFKANFIYQVPIGAGRAWAPENRYLNGLLSGWSVGSIITWQSGAPFSILSGLGTLNRSGRSQFNTAFTTSTVQQIASQVGVYHGQNGQVYLINPSFIGPDGRGAPNDALVCTPLIPGGFCNPAPGTVGNLPRNAFNGPAFFNMDLAILKDFAIGESKKLQYRVEMFNALNHPTFQVGDAVGSYDMNINDPNFGVATNTVSSPRVIQMGLRLLF